MNYEEKEVDINEIFNEVTKTEPQAPNTYPLQFELNSLKELFEFLLQFVTMLCKEFYADDKGVVNLAVLTPEQFNIIDRYMQSIGFKCLFQPMAANADNLNISYVNRYDRLTITPTTKLNELSFGIKCDAILFVISFEPL
tara:strand:+ start:227 stop:646 length:420 start_codon:yes stop_codon:yes gene_type:complete